MSFSDNLRKKLIDCHQAGCTIFLISKSTGIQRGTLSRFRDAIFNGINYENGMKLRRFLKKWEMENLYGKEKDEDQRASA